MPFVRGACALYRIQDEVQKRSRGSFPYCKTRRTVKNGGGWGGTARALSLGEEEEEEEEEKEYGKRRTP